MGLGNIRHDLPIFDVTGAQKSASSNEGCGLVMSVFCARIFSAAEDHGRVHAGPKNV